MINKLKHTVARFPRFEMRRVYMFRQKITLPAYLCFSLFCDPRVPSWLRVWAIGVMRENKMSTVTVEPCVKRFQAPNIVFMVPISLRHESYTRQSQCTRHRTSPIPPPWQTTKGGSKHYGNTPPLHIHSFCVVHTPVAPMVSNDFNLPFIELIHTYVPWKPDRKQTITGTEKKK